QRGHARVTAAGNVYGSQVERDADQLVAQRIGHELVDLLASLTGHAANDRASRFMVVQTQAIEGLRIEEGIEQAHRGVTIAILVDNIDTFGKHRMAKAIHYVRKLGEDVGIKLGIGLNDEDVDVWLDLTREFLEHEMLVFHLGDKAPRLEQACTVPFKAVS